MIVAAILLASLHASIPEQGGPEPGPAADAAWSFSAATYGYNPPDDDSYLSLILRADRGWLHLEARYNYEDLDTGSFFAGGNFSWGDEVSLAVTPMLGLVVGETGGVAPGLELDLAWKALSWYAESEYLIDFEESHDNFVYTWSELTLAPAGWVRLGLVAQRTRAYEQELEVDRGLLVGFSIRSVWVDMYLFNPDQDDSYGGFSLGLGF